MIVNVVVYNCQMHFDLQEDDIDYQLCTHRTDIYSYKCDDLKDVLYIMDYAKYKFRDVHYTIEVVD